MEQQKTPTYTNQVKLGIVALLVISLVLIMGIKVYDYYQPGYVYVVSIEEEQVGMIREKDELVKIINHLNDIESNKMGFDVAIEQDFSTERTFAWNPDVHPAQLQQQISSLASYEAAGTIVKVDGEPVVLVESRDVAEQILEEVTQFYIEEIQGELVADPEIVSDIEFDSIVADPKDIMDYETAKATLVQGTEREETYTVSRGDSLWSIAEEADMDVEELEKANPDMDPEMIKLGQEISLVVAEPALEVAHQEKVVREETIEYSTETKETSDLLRGQTRVATSGKNGIKENTYIIKRVNGKIVEEEKVESEVVKEPVTRVVERGTSSASSNAPASSGDFLWPISSGGRITSRFGPRGGGFHNGVDIAASPGTPIVAAESGRVVTSTYHGSYGNHVVIDHGNGYKTLYAHNSRNAVSVGDTVSRGQTIGYVGTTGRTTGPHVHFEIHRNGQRINPLNYFN
ncbi:peptidoglycan DD-metalloendopeptidase family protein [Proteinivorax tanatarense]|uniref:Peptidoglycan DD-metalloendopeptidase family protein n=1 Tax=Proteinivorax tanatarense TaxID=1260629 RepID=A0AAU7VM94_9FIRM